VCADGEVCDGAGACELSCQAGLVACGGTCIDPDTDRAYCGATGDCAGANAGAVCEGSEVCDAGVCAPLAPPITDLAVTGGTRQSVTLAWTAPAGAVSYAVKVSATELTAANFATTGTAVAAAAPSAPGAAEALTASALRTGTPVWFGVAAVDAGGNASAPAIVGPVTPAFDDTGAYVDASDGLKGIAMTTGLFNDDAFYDVALSSSGIASGGRVSVYFGGPTGVDGTADVVIDGTDVFGASLAAVRWSSATRHDLVVGAPYADSTNGRVFVFRGGATFGASINGPEDAGTVFGVDPTSTLFATAALGWSLAALDFDGDGTDDLAIGAPLGAGGSGAVAVVFGGTASPGTTLWTDSTAGSAVVLVVPDPRPDLYDVFGNFVGNVGRLQGAADPADDLLISYGDGSRVEVVRGATARPATPGITTRAASSADLRVTYAGVTATPEFGNTFGTLADVNGDGARELVLGAWAHAGDGALYVVDGDGTGVTTSASALLTIAGTAQYRRFGSGIVNNARLPGADVDGDGREDLLVMAREGVFAKLLVWFGGDLPLLAGTAAGASLVIDAPLEFDGGTILLPGSGYSNYLASWAGDVNGDGLADLCWSDQLGEANTGAFGLLWDDGN
jgi:hypothetical protein